MRKPNSTSNLVPLHVLALLSTLTFIGLKLVQHVNWTWWWVVSPLWIDLLIVFTIAPLFVIIVRGFRSNPELFGELRSAPHHRHLRKKSQEAWDNIDTPDQERRPLG